MQVIIKFKHAELDRLSLDSLDEKMPSKEIVGKIGKALQTQYLMS